jgi:hypothetical protein
LRNWACKAIPAKARVPKKNANVKPLLNPAWMPLMSIPGNWPGLCKTLPVSLIAFSAGAKKLLKNGPTTARKPCPTPLNWPRG